MARIVGVAGSLRAGSYNAMLLAQAVRLMPASSELVAWDELAAVPPFSEDAEDRPAAVVRELRAVLADAGGVLIVTPEYNGSIPGQLKNALDWASRPFPDNPLRSKPVAVVGASLSPGGAAHAQSEARTVLTRIGARVLDRGLSVPHAYRQFDPAGTLLDPVLAEALSALLDALTAQAGGLSAAVA